MPSKETLLVVCPGRGSYTADELGYIAKHHPSAERFIGTVDQWRRELGEATVSELDGAEKFSVRTHIPGHNASILIHSCAYLDYLAIDRERFDVVAVTGNSMGWYIALACAASLSEEGAFRVINTMGSMMKDEIVGGQVIYPIVGDDWRIDPERVQVVQDICREINNVGNGIVYPSINLGGYAVLGGDENGVRALLKRLPKVDDRYPFRLVGHAAFHTPLLRSTSELGKAALAASLFERPRVPMIDGRGRIWQPMSTDTGDLWDYTLGHQVYELYDFTAAIGVAVREFAPDRVVLLGPGGSLGGAIAQVLIGIAWQGIDSRQAFTDRQKQDPILVSMGRDEQRRLVV